jgi:hypothetical protein
VLDTDELLHDYTVDIPAIDGDLYVTVESYYQNVIPNTCTTGDHEGSTWNNPMMKYDVTQSTHTAMNNEDYR